MAYKFGVITYNDAQGVSHEDLAGSGSAPTFTYEALGPGKYSFFVIAYDSNGASKRADAAQNVTIVAPIDSVSMAHCLSATQLINKVGLGDGALMSAFAQLSRIRQCAQAAVSSTLICMPSRPLLADQHAACFREDRQPGDQLGVRG